MKVHILHSVLLFKISATTKIIIIKFQQQYIVCQSWTIKKAEHHRIDAFELWCWRRLLRVPWTVRRSKQSIQKEISPEYSLEQLMLKLKLQYFGHLIWKLTHWKRTWWWERLQAGGEGDDRWDGWMASPTWRTGVWASSGGWRWTGKLGVLQFMGSQRIGHTEWLNWTLHQMLSSSCKGETSHYHQAILFPSKAWNLALFEQTHRFLCFMLNFPALFIDFSFLLTNRLLESLLY